MFFDVKAVHVNIAGQFCGHMILVAWHALFFKVEEKDAATAPAAIAEALLDALTANGYTRYDPFPGGNGTPPALKTFVRQFVSPTRDGWVRVLGKSDTELLMAFKSQWPILYGWLDQGESETAGWRVLENGNWRTEAEAFTPFLKPNATVEMINRARSGELLPAPEPKSSVGGSPLPSDVQQLAAERGFDPKKADRMI